jgi:hypothetical protein
MKVLRLNGKLNYVLPWNVLGRNFLEPHILNFVPSIKNSQVVRKDFQYQANTLLVVEQDHITSRVRDFDRDSLLYQAVSFDAMIHLISLDLKVANQDLELISGSFHSHDSVLLKNSSNSATATSMNTRHDPDHLPLLKVLLEVFGPNLDIH